jgi:transcriptional regulator with XRE-family HTH domain
MIDTATIRAKRTAAGIPGSILCKKLGIARSRLSNVERGYLTASAEELERIDSALEELLKAQSVLRQTAKALGWPVTGVL